MNDKRLSREITLQILFQWEAQGLLAKKNCECPNKLLGLDIERMLGQFLQDFHVKDQAKTNNQQILFWLEKICQNISQIDLLIDKTSTKWRIERLDSIDRAILRLASLELIIEKKLSPNIIINEAIELAKKYGSENSSSFINGLLDAIKNIPGPIQI